MGAGRPVAAQTAHDQAEARTLYRQANSASASLGLRAALTRHASGFFGNGPDGHGNTLDIGRTSGIWSKFTATANLAQISDGTSNTILMGEVRPDCSDHIDNGWEHVNALWCATTAPINFPTCPNDPVLPDNCHMKNNWNTSQGFKSQHVGGAHFVLCDGSVRFLSQNLDYATYQKLGDRRDGQTVGEF